jgi:FAD/FMN-containing dehydrogenase
VFLFSVPDLAAVLALFQEARVGPFVVMAYEFFTERCLARLRRHRSVRTPLASPSDYYVLLEVERGEPEALESWIASLLDRGLITDGTLAQHATQAAELWALREGISESLSATGLPHKNDIALPIQELQGFCTELEGFFEQRYPGWEIALFGHIGDGNLHVNVLPPEGMALKEFMASGRDITDAVEGTVTKAGGTFSAEHGVGQLRKATLAKRRSALELELMRAVKRALDPQGILNPGKVFDPE